MEMLNAKERGEPYDVAAFERRLTQAVREVVEKQVQCGIDIVNDGEFSKVSWLSYFADRLAGTERRPMTPGGPNLRVGPIHARDAREFPEWFEVAGNPGYSWVLRLPALRSHEERPISGLGMWTHCVGPLSYKGQLAVQIDIENLKAAAEGLDVADVCLTSLGPATLEYFLANDFYKTDEELVHAIASAMREEYKAITDAGIVLQLDEPALLTNWQVFPDMSVEEFRRWAEIRVEALNDALRGIPEDLVRIHCCWGSTHFPHKNDIPLERMLDILLRVNVEAYSLEAANPRHDHEWQVWRDIKLPEGKILIPGVVGHFTDFIEHPGLVADRLQRYANVAGKENVIAGTDCGLGTRVGHPSLGWAKFSAMSEGARMASRSLWY